MKRTLISSLSQCLSALTLTTLLFGASCLQAQTPTEQQTNPAVTSPAVPAAKDQAFDGKKLYHAVFEILRHEHITLVDADARNKFIAEWEHKHDNDHALDSEEGADKACLEMVHSLHQRFDYYLSPAMAQEQKDEIDPKLAGIGAAIHETHLAEIVNALSKTATQAEFETAAKLNDRHQAEIEEVYPEGPAALAGLQAGDLIVAVDGKSVNGQGLGEMVAHVRGEVGTKVQVQVLRTDATGHSTTVNVTIERAKVHVPVAHYKDLGNGLAYVRLDNFMSRTTMPEMGHALALASSQKALILDLRSDPGGELQNAMAVAGFLIPDGFLVNLRNRDDDHMDDTRMFLTPDAMVVIGKSGDTKDKGQMELNGGPRPPLIIAATMPIVVLIDRYTASASELVTAALVHNLGDRVKVVGMPSIGKNVGQSSHDDLPFGRELEVTSFEFQAGGVSYDWVGITPNIQLERPVADTDAQLEAAKKAATDMLAAQAKLAEQQKQQRQEHEEIFKDQIK